MFGWCIRDLISKRIHRGSDSSAGRREVFPLLTKTTRERSRISFPGGFIEAEIRPLVEEKSFLSWRRRPDRQTDREPETDIWDTPEERRPGTARISFPSGFIEARFVYWWKRSLCLLDEDDQTDREPETEIWDNPEERRPGTANTKGTSSSSSSKRRRRTRRFLVATMTMEAVAELLGIGVPMLRFLVCFLASIPCSWLWRYVPSAAARHLYAAATGALLSYFSFGAASNVYFGILMLVSYASMLFSRRHCGIITFVIAFAFLITW